MTLQTLKLLVQQSAKHYLVQGVATLVTMTGLAGLSHGRELTNETRTQFLESGGCVNMISHAPRLDDENVYKGHLAACHGEYYKAKVYYYSASVDPNISPCYRAQSRRFMETAHKFIPMDTPQAYPSFVRDVIRKGQPRECIPESDPSYLR